MSDGIRLQCCLPSLVDTALSSEKKQYLNEEVVLNCGDNSITPGIIIPAGSYASYDSQAKANYLALAEALIQRSINPCIWNNTEQTYTATCTAGAGTKTITVSSGTYFSTVDQADADAQALAAATKQAQEQLVCL